MRPGLFAVVLLVAALSAGCSRPITKVSELPTGPLDKKAYVHAFDVSAAGLAPRYGVGEPLEKGATAAQQEARVVGVQRLLRAWATRIAGLRPPAPARRAQIRYVAGVRGFADDLEQARTALAHGDVAGANHLLNTAKIVSPQTRADLIAARRAFHALHYDLADLDTAPVKTP